MTAYRVCVVSPEPTPYRSPLFDRIAAHPSIDLSVVYASRTLEDRGWSVNGTLHRATYLEGRTLPFRRILHHPYPVTPGIWPILTKGRFDCVVIAGWSLFAAQAAIVWCRLHATPYVLMSESHLAEPRATWKLALKRAVLPQLIRPAAGLLATGTRSSEHLVAYGGRRERIEIFANTVDTEEFARAVDERRVHRGELRKSLGVEDSTTVVLYVGRLVPQKGVETLIRAAAQAGAQAELQLLIVGDGPERPYLEQLAAGSGARATFAGAKAGEALLDAYAAADVFVLPSYREPWGVVVNEAAASALPLILTTGVGAAPDLLEDGRNGVAVPAGDVTAIAEALTRFAFDPPARIEAGKRSREIAGNWGYATSVEGFVRAVSRAVEKRR